MTLRAHFNYAVFEFDQLVSKKDMDKLDEFKKKLDVVMFVLLIIFVGIMISLVIIDVGEDFLSF